MQLDQMPEAINLTNVSWFDPPEQSDSAAIEAELTEEAAPRLQWLMFTSQTCGPCRAAKLDFEQWLTASGWRVSDSPDAHVRLIDGDAAPDLLAKYEVTSYPTFILQNGETEFLRHTGYPGRKVLAQEFNEVATLTNSLRTGSGLAAQRPVGQLAADESGVKHIIENYRRWFGDQQPIELSLNTERTSETRLHLNDQTSIEFGPVLQIRSSLNGSELSIRFAKPFPRIRLNWLIPIEQPIEGLTLDAKQLTLQLPRFPDLKWKVGNG
jgi:thiol-disulfide isomerase/thioredoxin